MSPYLVNNCLPGTPPCAEFFCARPERGEARPAAGERQEGLDAAGGGRTVRGKGCGRKRRAAGCAVERKRGCGRKEERRDPAAGVRPEGEGVAEGKAGVRPAAGGRSGEKGAVERKRGCPRRITPPPGPGCSTGRRRPGYPRRARPGSSSGCPVRSARRGNAASPRRRARSRASRECGGSGSG